MEEHMESRRMCIIMTAAAVLCFSMLAQSDPVAAAEATLADSSFGEQHASAAQTDGSTLQDKSTPKDGVLPQTISPAETQPCDKTGPEDAETMTGRPREFAQNCVPHGQKCTLGGVPCCSPYTCLGVPPNLTCQ